MKLIFMTDPDIYEQYQAFFSQDDSEDLIYICDTDESIKKTRALNAPVIAIAHPGNVGESLMDASFLVDSVEALTPDFLAMVLARHRQLPLTILETDRCQLRELIREDLPFLLTLQEENVCNPFGSFFPPSCRDPESYLADYIRFQYPFFGFGIYLIREKDSGLPVGIAGYSPYQEVETATLYTEVCTEAGNQLVPLQLGKEDTVIEIGYCICRDRQKKGLASEVLPPLIRYGRQNYGFDRILAVTEPSNKESLQLARKTGLEPVFLSPC